MAQAAVSDDDLRVDDSGTPTSPAYRDEPASIDTLAGRDPVPKGLLDDLTTLQKRKMATDTAVEDRTLAHVDQDRADMARWHSATGASLDDVKPWNAEAERKKYDYNPFEAFGSFASLFAIAASAFTKAPAENALNGAAAAMNAVRAGDDQAYERAFTAWKENNALAIKRGEMMHQQYSDALGMMDTDYKRGALEMTMAARRFGDQQVLTMLDHGYNEQAFELISKRAAAVEGLAKADEQITESSVRKQVFDAEIKGLDKNVKDPVARAGYTLDAFNRVYGNKQMTNPAMEAMGTIMHQHGPGTQDPWTAEQFVDYAEKHHLLPYSGRGATSVGSKQALIQSEYESLKDTAPWMSDTERLEEANRRAEVLVTKRTGPGATQEVVDQKKAEIKKANPGMSDADAAIHAQREVKIGTAVPSGNRVDQLKARGDQIKYADELITQVETLLKKHDAIAGLGGRVTRPGEVLADVISGGANGPTDRKQFERFINELQLLMPRILTDSQGRPLGAEASHITSIVAGLNLGDTVANTTRAMRELQKQLAEMRKDTDARMGGGGASREQPAPTGDTPRWMQAPEVK
jgi:hypothetical protein